MAPQSRLRRDAAAIAGAGERPPGATLREGGATRCGAFSRSSNRPRKINRFPPPPGPHPRGVARGLAFRIGVA